MMKVYQPVCPDMKFRLVADLSPDGVEVSEDSTVSSDSASCLSDDDDIKMKVHEDSPAATPHPLSRYPCNRFSPSSASATPVSASDIRQEDEVSSAVTESACLRSELLLSASAQPSALSGGFAGEETHASGADCTDNCLVRVCPQAQSATAGAGHSTPHKDGMVQLPTSTQSHGEKIVSATAHMNGMSAADSAASCAMQKPVCVYEKIYNSIKPFTQQEMDKDDDCMCGGGGGVDGDSDDDNASIEDVSISHNVPMCPPSPAPFSPARTPPIARKMMKAKADREAKAVSSSSSSRAGRHEQSRSSRLHLDVNTPSKKPGSPYTLACAITPSPLLEQTSLATALASASSGEPADPCPPLSSCEATAGHTAATQPPEQLPESPDSPQGDATDTSAMNRSIYDEIQEALIKEVSGDTLEDHPPAVTTADKDPAQQYPFIHKHMGHLFDKKRLLIGYASVQPVRHRDVSTSPCRSGYSSTGRSRHVSAASTASEAATSVEEALYMNRLGDRPGSDGEEEEEVIGVSLVDDEPEGAACATVFYGQKRRRKNSDGDGSRRHSSSTMATPYSDLEVTHRGMHRFIPRHADEVQIGIGDPIHVVKEFDDLWCEGVNLRSGERGIFPAMYANDLTFLEESEDEDEHWKFTMRFLGTVEVTSASGDVALCQAINKVAQQERIRSASLCILEINQYGIRMIDKSKEGHESQKFSFFFALKNISFCGTHPNNNRYFAFITKHPHEARFACHVFHSERSTHRARDALGKAFKRFYQEYMAFTHPTEDIWIE